MWQKRVTLTLTDGVWTAEYAVKQGQIPVTKPELIQAARTLEVSHRDYISKHTLATYHAQSNDPKTPAAAATSPAGAGSTQEQTHE